MAEEQEISVKPRRSLKVKKKEEGGEEWLTTYADSITLLMAFFVMLLSVSEPDPDKFKELTKNMMSGFIQEMIETPFETIFTEFQIIIEDNAVEKDISAEFTNSGVMLDLDASSFFQPGTASFKEEAKPLLREMADTIVGLEMETYTVIVEGHTDDVPISNNSYPSNWELSALRATNVVRFLEASGVRHDFLQAMAFADANPKVPNIDEYGDPIPENRALNRRIQIRIERVLDK